MGRARLPSMTYLHDTQEWKDFYRFGAGQHYQDNFLPVARQSLPNEADRIIGLFWVDQSMRIDYGINEPWWCINAIAVDPEFERCGLGTGFVNMIREQACHVGVTSIYGLSHPSGYAFWEAQPDFTLLEPGAPLGASQPVQLRGGQLRQARFDSEPGHRFFYNTVTETGPGGRLMPGDPCG